MTKAFAIHRIYATLLGKLARLIDWACAHAARSKSGARIVNFFIPELRPLLCAACFNDHGLRLEAEKIGFVHALPCPNCGALGAKKLNSYFLPILADQFFVRGSLCRPKYGGYPRLQFNDRRSTDYDAPSWLCQDVALISEKTRIGIFEYGPRFWMFGEIEPLKALEDAAGRQPILERIVTEYPSQTLAEGDYIYRLRRDPANPMNPDEYDSPPDEYLGNARLDSSHLPILYCSKDIEGCVHECRVTVEDELYLATLRPTRDLKLLDLSAILREEVTEFESLDLAIQMIFFAATHSYEISREIATAAHKAGFDGLIYPSYFSHVRSGEIPFETVYGMSVRRLPGAKNSSLFQNIGLFGRPIKQALAEVSCINRLMLHKIRYEIHFGPARRNDVRADDSSDDEKPPKHGAKRSGEICS